MEIMTVDNRTNQLIKRIESGEKNKITKRRIPDDLAEAIREAKDSKAHEAKAVCNRILDYVMIEMDERRKIVAAIELLDCGRTKSAADVLRTVDPFNCVGGAR